MGYLGILAAAVGAWIFGAIWYGVLGKQYQLALGLNPEECKGKPMPIAPLVACFLGELVMAAVLFWLLEHLSVVGWMWGAHAGLLIGAGIVLPTVIINHMFPGRTKALMVIDGLHWVIVVAIEGAVLGAFA
jgi:hypothetical protein